MKRAVSFFFLLACCGLLLGDSPDPGRAARQQASLLQDLVRMTNAGFSDETVLEYAKGHRAELPSLVSAEDLVWLRKSGVSETVVRYMTAIDVRASEEGAGEDVAYDSAEAAGYARYSPSAAYSYPDSDYGYADGGYYGGYPETYYADSYPDTYYADYYPFFGAGYYPYPVYFFVNNSGFFGRFHGRRHGFDGRRHGFDRRHGGGFHRGGFDRRSSSRGFAGRRGGMVADHRGPSRSASQGRGFGPGPAAPRGAVLGHGGPRPPAFSRGGPGPAARTPQGGAGRGAFGHPGLSGGARAGGGFGHGPAARSGGGPRVVGRAGGRGR
jgi:hypothetical protein